MKYKFPLTFAIAAILITTLTPVSAAVETLKITNLSGTTYNFTDQQLAGMPKTTVYADLYCYGNLVTNGEWGGIQLKYLLNQTEVSSDVISIQFVAADSYAIAIPIQVANSPQTIIAYQKNGEQLLEGLRLVLPGYNGASWISQIVSISMSNDVVFDPVSISVDGGVPRSVLSDFNGKVNPPMPTSVSTPSPEPATSSPTPNLTAPLLNNTEIEPTPNQQTANPQSINLDQVTIPAVAAVITFILTATILAYRRRTKLKDNLITAN